MRTKKHALIALSLSVFLCEGLYAQSKIDTSVVNLGEIKISGKYYRKYNSGTVSSVLRLRTPLLKLSQSIETVPSALLRDQGAFNLTDAVTRNVSGVVRQEVSNNIGPNIFMRGGQISALRNGMDLSPLYRGPMPDDAAIIERVEFIKGPSLYMNNIGDPAGSFNVLTKQPEGRQARSVSAMLGSWDFYRLSADVQGTTGRDQRFQYRLNAMAMKSRSFVDFDFNNRMLLAPVVKYNINDHSYVSAEYIFQKFSYALQSPIVMSPDGFGTLPPHFSIHEKSLKPYKPTDQNAFFTYKNQFNSRWGFTTRVSLLKNDSEGAYMWVTGVNSADPQVLLRNPKYDLTRYYVFSEQAFLNGTFRTGAVTHHLLAGMDVNQKRFRGSTYLEYDKLADGTLNYYPLSIAQPSYGVQVPNYTLADGPNNGNTRQSADYISAYALDELHFFKDKVRLTLGLRATFLRTYNSVSGTTANSSDKVITPRVGLNYLLRHDMSVYILHDQTFQPQTGLQGLAVAGSTQDYVAGAAVNPLKGDIWEAGVKKDWDNGKWNTTLSVYQIHRRNIAEAIPSTNFKNQIGQSSSKGVDVDIKGEVVKHLNVVINYSYNDSRVSKTETAGLTGVRTPMYVKHIQNTWLEYTLPAKFLPGLGLSLGYQYMAGRGERFATATQQHVPSYTRLDAGINWRFRNISANFLVNNFTGRADVATPWYKNGLYYWVPNSPRSFRLSTTIDF